MPLFIAAGIAAAGAIGGSLISSNATSSAANAQQQAANTATAEQSREFNQTQTNLAPWLNVGTGALGQLANLYGITPASPASFTGGTSGGTSQGLTPGMMAALGASKNSGPGTLTRSVIDPASIGSSALGIPNPIDNTISHLFGAGNNSPIQDIAQALAQGKTITDAQWAQAGYGPGGSAPGQQPTLAQTNPVAGNNVGPGSAPNVNPYATFYQSPDYQFRLAQGIGGVDAGAAARGALDSGATRKAEISYAGNLAAGDYNNYANRLAALAGVGQTAANNLGTLGANYASNVGNIAIGQGNNLASSYLANGQTYGNTVGALANIGSGLIQNGAFGGSAPATYANGNWTPGPGGFPIA